MLVVYATLSVIILLLIWVKLSEGNKKHPPDHNLRIVNVLTLGFRHERLWDKIVRLSSACVKLGGITRLKADKTYYLITDPEAISATMNSCLDKGVFYDFLRPWLGEGILTASALSWKKHRKNLNPMFHQRIMDSYLPNFDKQAEKMVQILSAQVGTPFDPYFCMLLHNIETVCLTLFGVDENKDKLHKYAEAVANVLDILRERFQRFWLHKNFIYNFTQMKKQEDKCVRTIHQISTEIINIRKHKLRHVTENGKIEDSPEAVPYQYKALLDHLIELEENKIYTQEDIRQQVDNLMLAGADSTATTTTFTLVLLGSHPEVQEKAFNEIQEVLGPRQHLEHTDLSKLVYLEAVIKESIRLYPFTPVVSRYLAQDVTFKDYTLNAGSTIFYLFHSTHRLPLWGNNAEHFDPERWLRPGGVPAHPAAFCGFSWGRRNCLGKPFAMVSLKTTLAYLIRNFKVTADRSKLRLELNFVAKIVEGQHVILQKRI